MRTKHLLFPYYASLLSETHVASSGNSPLSISLHFGMKIAESHQQLINPIRSQWP